MQKSLKTSILNIKNPPPPQFLLVMISMDKDLKLIKIYMCVCKQYDENQNYYYQRYSNNSIPVFID